MIFLRKPAAQASPTAIPSQLARIDTMARRDASQKANLKSLPLDCHARWPVR